MGLAGLGGGDVTPPTGDLATLMQDEGTNDQNADIVNLYLAESNLIVGAPPPIEAASNTEPVQTLVFNSNFSRERYGKASVNDKIALESDRISLLLDNNQSDAQKALSLISALEFSNGLTAVQNMSDSDVTSRDQPELDVFDNYPESMFNNATLLSNPKQTFIFDAISASTQAIQAFTSYQ
jgi:hypothetical protein